MTGRQRLRNILDGKPVDRVAWTTLVDDRTRSVMPEAVRKLHILDFYRHIGCDMMLFGNYGLPGDSAVTHPCRWVTPGTETQWTSDGPRTARRVVSQWGTLTAEYHNWHPTRYPIQTLVDLDVYRRIWESSLYEEQDGTEATYSRLEEKLGEDGIFVPIVEPSPVQQLIENEMGLESFYYFLQDHQREVEDLLAVMHARRMQEYEICGRRYPCDAIIPVENTSSTLVSPEIYRRYSLPQVRDFVDVAHKHGKKAVLHMCGLLKNLLPVIRETGMDGINALTPPPVGDCPWEHAMDVLGDDLLILGGVFDGSVFQKPSVAAGEIEAGLRRAITPRIRNARILVWFVADGLPTPVERFYAARDWMAKEGQA